MLPKCTSEHRVGAEPYLQYIEGVYLSGNACIVLECLERPLASTAAPCHPPIACTTLTPNSPAQTRKINVHKCILNI